MDRAGVFKELLNKAAQDIRQGTFAPSGASR
jgi:hypothetical protein